MSPEISGIVNEQIKDRYNGKITLSGFGEPLLNPQLESIIESVEHPNLVLYTNGDALTAKRVDSLLESGLRRIRVSLYDDEYLENIHNCLADKIEYTILDYRSQPLYLVNRNDIFNGSHNHHKDNPCYLPSYKMFVDWDGEVRLCANDWRGVLSFGNVREEKLNDIWLSEEFSRYRFNNRKCSPCNGCHVNGTLEGQNSQQLLKAHFFSLHQKQSSQGFVNHSV